jgi:dTDP-4-dehydrorhamnose reductase
MNILNNAIITGGTGMVGNYIDFGIKPTSIEMDITDILSIHKYISSHSNISCIIHLVALNLRDCEKNYSNAIKVNIEGTINMLSVAKEKNIPFIYISTGAVFSSKQKNVSFDEDTVTNPNSMYGITKDIAEKISLLYKKTIIIRTGWLFGGHQKTHFKFVETVINNLITNTIIYASNDFYGSPTYVKDFIERLKVIILNLDYRIHHIINDGIANGFDIANEIANILNKDPSLIKSVSSKEIPNSGPERSKSEILNSKYKLRSWKTSLNEYVLSYITKL